MAGERGKSRQFLADLMVGEFEFDTTKFDKNKNPRRGGYMIAEDNVETQNAYKKAKDLRIKTENELVHRQLHPLFEMTEEDLREYDANKTKEAEEQKRKSREVTGWSTPAEMARENDDGSDDSQEVVVVYGSAKRRRFKIFTKENTGKKKYGGWSEVGIDKMEKLERRSGWIGEKTRVMGGWEQVGL